MNIRTVAIPLALLLAVGTMTACGGGSGGNAGATPEGGDGGEDSFIAIVRAMIASSPDDSEPVDVGAIVATTPDSTEPSGLGS